MDLDGPVIVSSRVSVLYPSVAKIRRFVFKLEDEVQEYGFLSSELVPVPDNIPPEVPRIIFTSEFGHSTLSFSPIRADLRTTYDEDFNTDLDRCLQYVIEKSGALRVALDEIETERSVTAMSIKARWSPADKELDHDTLTNRLKGQFLAEPFNEGGRDFHNVRLQYTVVEKEHLFRLVTIGSYRTYDIKDESALARLDVESEAELTDYGVEKEVEINDRRGFNRGLESSGLDQLDEFAHLIRNALSEPIPNLQNS